MSNANRMEAEEARSQFSDLLDATEVGRSTIITRRGQPFAAIVPIREYVSAGRQYTLMSLAGTGRGMWGKSSPRAIRRTRGEWTR